MYEKYWVVNEIGEIEGSAWHTKNGYIASVPSLGKNYFFKDFDEMTQFLWKFLLDIE